MAIPHLYEYMTAIHHSKRHFTAHVVSIEKQKRVCFVSPYYTLIWVTLFCHTLTIILI